MSCRGKGFVLFYLICFSWCLLYCCIVDFLNSLFNIRGRNFRFLIYMVGIIYRYFWIVGEECVFVARAIREFVR